jgi:hypothetical protein
MPIDARRGKRGGTDAFVVPIRPERSVHFLQMGFLHISTDLTAVDPEAFAGFGLGPYSSSTKAEQAQDLTSSGYTPTTSLGPNGSPGIEL